MFGLLYQFSALRVRSSVSIKRCFEATLMSSLRFSSSYSPSFTSPPKQELSSSPSTVEHPYRCKSALKLVEINKTYPIFTRQVDTVVDLCAAPGGFSQVAVEAMLKRRQRESHTNRRELKGRRNDSKEKKMNEQDVMVVAVDAREIDPLPHVRTLKASVLDHEVLLNEIQQTLGERVVGGRSEDPGNNASEVAGGGGGRKSVLNPSEKEEAKNGKQRQHRRVQVVLHDGVSVVAGQHAYSVTYAQNHMALSALQLALSLFALNRPWMGKLSSKDNSQTSKGSDGENVDDPRHITFLTKTLVSPHMDRLLDVCRVFFGRVHLVHAEATRAGSLERYIVAQGLKKRQASEWIAMQRSPNSPTLNGEGKHNKNNISGSGASGNVSLVGPHLFSLPPQTIDIPTGKQSVWICFGCHQRRFGAAPCPVCTRDTSKKRI